MSCLRNSAIGTTAIKKERSGSGTPGKQRKVEKSFGPRAPGTGDKGGPVCRRGSESYPPEGTVDKWV